MPTTALIADDEPLLRERLAAHLARLWPALAIVAEARNGREAIERFDELAPDIVFLDIHMPGLTGLDAARAIGRRAQIVFVTAYEQYAVQAFEQGAIDYLVKPFDEPRLADTVQRLQSRRSPEGPPLDALLDRLAGELAARTPPRRHLQWIRASVGPALRLIPVDEVVYLKSDEKYTLVAWAGGEALLRKPLRELADELDPAVFVQVHRSVIVNLRHVKELVRQPNETADLHLKGRPEVLPVSRSYLAQFRPT